MDLIKYEDKETIKVLKQTVAVGASDAEFAMFVEFCKSTGLNPFKKEVWFTKTGSRVQMMTGINGFRAIANSSPAYDGIEIGLINAKGECVSASYAGDDYIGAWARAHRKDRKVPTEGIAMLADYNKKQGNWNSMKRVMIMKCAESVALRQAFPQQLNGLYTQEEMPVEYASKGDGDGVVVESGPPLAEFAILNTSSTPGEPYDHIIETKCRFEGASVGDAYASDPDWLVSVHNTPKKWDKMSKKDQAAISKFMKQIIIMATTPLKDAVVDADKDMELFKQTKE